MKFPKKQRGYTIFELVGLTFLIAAAAFAVGLCIAFYRFMFFS